MATIVVGGSGRGVGKTALVCGLIAALPELAFAAVKITTHEHGYGGPILEETPTGRQMESDTARYLAAGARRALLVSASEDDIAERVGELRAMLGDGANVIFESNRIVDYLEPDLCLGVLQAGELAEGSRLSIKASFRKVLSRADALVARGNVDLVEAEPAAAKPLFRLADLERISPEMVDWVRSALHS